METNLEDSQTQTTISKYYIIIPFVPVMKSHQHSVMQISNQRVWTIKTHNKKPVSCNKGHEDHKHMRNKTCIMIKNVNDPDLWTYEHNPKRWFNPWHFRRCNLVPGCTWGSDGWVSGENKDFPPKCKESPPCSGPRVHTPALEHTPDQCITVRRSVCLRAATSSSRCILHSSSWACSKSDTLTDRDERARDVWSQTLKCQLCLFSVWQLQSVMLKENAILLMTHRGQHASPHHLPLFSSQNVYCGKRTWQHKKVRFVNIMN